jgi:membrane-associated phospholipid phosphatase
LKTKLANYISDIFNPLTLSILFVFLLAKDSTENLWEAIRWSFIFIVLCMLPIFLVILNMVKKGKLQSVFSNPREQRHILYVLGSVMVGAALIVLIFIGAPDKLIAALFAGFVSSVLFMIVNFFWKISVHTAFASAFSSIALMLYGYSALGFMLLVPMMAWARVYLKEHTMGQVTAGALLAGTVIVTVFNIFNMVNI